MRIIIAMLLIGAALVTLAPPASACEVSDPSGITATCVNNYEWANGDCDTGGYEGGGTYAYSFIPGVGFVYAHTYDECYSDPPYSASWSGTEASADVEALGSGAGAQHDNYDSSFGSYCDTHVYTYGAPDDNYVPLGCPLGPL